MLQDRTLCAGAPSDISVLVNNAGVMGVGPEEDGSDGHLRLNHFGPFLLTRLLLPRMAAHGRIVNVGSEAHYRGTLQIDNGRVQVCLRVPHQSTISENAVSQGCRYPFQALET